MSNDIKTVPDLPQPTGTVFDDGYWLENKLGPIKDLPFYATRKSDFYTAEQMHAYAEAAVLASVQAADAMPKRFIEYRVKTSASNGTWEKMEVSQNDSDGSIEERVKEEAERDCGYSEHYRGYEWRHIAEIAALQSAGDNGDKTA